MSDVKRYDFDYGDGEMLGVHCRPDGDYVLASDYDALAAAARKVTQHHLDTCDESKLTGPCSCGVDDLRALLGGE